jgi:hypothetical protein
VKKILIGAILAASASMSSAQVTEECDPLNSDTFCLDPFEEPGATFGDGVIGAYRPGTESALIAILNPNNPWTLPPSPIFPTDPVQPVVLTRP